MPINKTYVKYFTQTAVKNIGFGFLFCFFNFINNEN